MKKSLIYLSCALAMGLGSCSSDENAPAEVNRGSDGNVYATLSLNLGTRSETVSPGGNPSQSDTGFEYGQDYENKVNDVYIVLASKDETSGAYTFISASSGDPLQVSNSTNGAAGAPNPLYKVKFKTGDIIPYADKTVHVFAYCNLPAELAEQVTNKNSWSVDLQYPATLQTDLIWQTGDGGDFMMTSALETSVTMPSEIAMETVYNNETNPCDLGTVKVERVAARFDFASTTITGVTGLTGPNQYPIHEYLSSKENSDDQTGSVPVGTGAILGYVELDGMALVNQADNFYCLPRVAAGNTANTAADMTKITLLGQETTNNWVISPDPKTYSSWFGNTSNAVAPGTFSYDPLPSTTPDNNQNWNSDGSYGDYYIWRYTTENTIPSIEAQKYGITTGVVFRGKISAPEGSKLATALATGSPIYAYEGVMYGTLADLIDYVSQLPGSDVGVAFQESFNVTIDLNNLTTTEAIKNYLTTQGISNLSKSDDNFNMYTPTTVGSNSVYYVYYFYPNRHNDNGNNGRMGPMEFATVRNNVYKLKVNNIFRWGNPSDKPFDPDKDDESPEVYFRVQVEVLPWVVRINNIDF